MKVDEFGRIVRPSTSSSHVKYDVRKQKAFRSNPARQDEQKRSQSPPSNAKRPRSRSPPSNNQETLKKQEKDETSPPAKEEPKSLEVKEDEEEMMARMLGFGSFNSTKGQHVQDERVNVYSADVTKKRKFRQYMNRKGGYDQPLRNNE